MTIHRQMPTESNFPNLKKPGLSKYLLIIIRKHRRKHKWKTISRKSYPHTDMDSRGKASIKIEKMNKGFECVSDHSYFMGGQQKCRGGEMMSFFVVCVVEQVQILIDVP